MSIIFIVEIENYNELAVVPSAMPYDTDTQCVRLSSTWKMTEKKSYCISIPPFGRPYLAIHSTSLSFMKVINHVPNMLQSQRKTAICTHSALSVCIYIIRKWQRPCRPYGQLLFLLSGKNVGTNLANSK